MKTEVHPFESGEIIDVYLRNSTGWSYHGCTRDVRRNFSESSQCVFVHERTGKRYRRNGEEVSQ